MPGSSVSSWPTNFPKIPPTLADDIGGANLVENQMLNDGTKVDYYSNEREIYTYKNGTTITVFPDGTRIQRNPEGQVSVTDKGGVTNCLFKDGTKLRREADGTQITACLDGTIITEPASGEIRKHAVKKDGSVIDTYRDGRKRGQFPDGTIVEEADKVKTTIKRNGTVIKDFLDALANDRDDPDSVKVKECRFEDGAVVYTFKSGRTLQVDTDGFETEVLPDRTKRQTNPDGVVIVSFADGRKVSTNKNEGVIVTQYPDGRREQEHPDGTHMTIKRNGDAIARRKDGTVIETFAAGPIVQIDRLKDGRIITVYRNGSTSTDYGDGSGSGPPSVPSNTSSGGGAGIAADKEPTAPPMAPKRRTSSTASVDDDASKNRSESADWNPPVALEKDGKMGTETIRYFQYFLNQEWDRGAAIVSRGKKRETRLRLSGKLDRNTLRSLQFFLNTHADEAKLNISKLKTKGIEDNEMWAALKRFLNTHYTESDLQKSRLRGSRMDQKAIRALQSYLNTNLHLE